MARKNKTISDTWRWGLYLVIGVLFMAGVVFFSSWQALRATEARFCQILDFVKSQSTSFEKYNDTITAKALRRTAASFTNFAPWRSAARRYRCISWHRTLRSTFPTRNA